MVARMISDNSYLWAWKLERNSTLHITCTTWGYPGNVDLKLLYAIFRQADSMQSLTLTLTLAYNNLRSTFPGLPIYLAYTSDNKLSIYRYKEGFCGVCIEKGARSLCGRKVKETRFPRTENSEL